MECAKEDKLSFDFQPSLQHMAMVKIAIEMWVQDEVMASMPNIDFFQNEYVEQMDAIDKIREKVRSFRLPEQLFSELKAFIKPIGRQIFHWYEYLDINYSLERMNPKELCWRPQGTIDKKKSVLVLIGDQRLDVEKRYELARSCCSMEELDDLILKGQGPNGEFIEMHSKALLTPGLFDLSSVPLSFDTFAKKILFQKIFGPAEKALIVYYTNLVLEKYYDELISDCTFEYAPHEFYADLLCSLLSRMDRGQQMQIFENSSQIALECLLIWPYHGFFMETAKRVWRFIGKKDFYSLMVWINYELDFGSKVNVYRDIFQQFWRFSSADYKTFVIEHEDFLYELNEMLSEGETGVARIILNELNASEKEYLVCAHSQVFAFYEYVIDDKDKGWDALKFFIEQCAPSEETIIKVKNLMVNFEAKQNRKKEFLQILDSFIPGEKK